MSNAISFMGVKLQLATKAQLLTEIEQASPLKAIRIATVNPEFMLEAQKNTKFKAVLSAMDYCTIDGSGLYFALKAHFALKRTKPSLELYHGSDLAADLFKKYSNGSKTFFFIGGPPGLNKTAKEVLENLYPSIRIVGQTDGGIIDKENPQIEVSILNVLKESQPDILLVGFGAPKQELWMEALSKLLPIPVMIGVGGTLGFYATKKRAPFVMRLLHLEWFYRGLTEPGHWKRLWNAVVVFSFYSLMWIGKERA